MAIRNVVLEGDEILRKKCRDVGEVTDRIRMTMEDMLETMRSQYGVGIAAPQVGIMRRMFVAEPEPERVYYQRYIPFSAIIAVHGSYAVDKPDPVFDGKPRTRSYLCLISRRNFDK